MIITILASASTFSGKHGPVARSFRVPMLVSIVAGTTLPQATVCTVLGAAEVLCWVLQLQVCFEARVHAYFFPLHACHSLILAAATHIRRPYMLVAAMPLVQVHVCMYVCNVHTMLLLDTIRHALSCTTAFVHVACMLSSNVWAMWIQHVPYSVGCPFAFHLHAFATGYRLLKPSTSCACLLPCDARAPSHMYLLRLCCIYGSVWYMMLRISNNLSRSGSIGE